MATLGDRVKDKITGMVGIVICDAHWLFGCHRFTIQPEEVKDGKAVDSYCIDADQCEVVVKRAINPYPVAKARKAGKKAPAGPTSTPTRQLDPAR